MAIYTKRLKIFVSFDLGILLLRIDYKEIIVNTEKALEIVEFIKIHYLNYQNSSLSIYNKTMRI